MKDRKSNLLFDRARRVIPGGVNSPVRAFKSVGRSPLFISRAKGSAVWDVDGNRYIDYVGSWGPMILGHSHPKVIAAVRKAAQDGTSFGAATQREVELAELVIRLMPSLGMVRMVNSGTEATMSAIRLARAFTGRDKILKFEGCYHGHADAFLIKAGSGAATFGIPDSAGVPASVARDTLTAPYNDLNAVRDLVDRLAGEIAAIIVEPVVGNMGCVPPVPGFLQGLRQLCTERGIVLIFDEVMTGFRIARGGAQKLYDLTPDLTTLGKIIGGGLPVGAYGGRKEIMSLVAPLGPMYQAGTLSGNPLAMEAGIETLKFLKHNPSVHRRLESVSARLQNGLQKIIADRSYPLSLNRVGSMFTLFFSTDRVTNFEEAVRCDTKRFGVYFNEMLRRGIYLPPSQFEAAFVSLAHTQADIDQTIDAAKESLEIALSK